MDIALKIDQLRRKKGLTQIKIAEKIGISVMAFQNGLKRNDFKVSLLIKIADVLEVPITYFFGNEYISENQVNIPNNEDFKELTENYKVLKQLVKHQNTKIKNLHITIKHLISELMLHDNTLKNSDTYNSLFYFLQFYRDDLDKETIERLETLTQRFSLKLGNKKD